MTNQKRYRMFYEDLLDDTDFLQMDDRAFRLLFVLKMSLGPWGIGPIKRSLLAMRARCTDEQLEEAFHALEKPKTDEDHGWIIRDGKLVWLINGLKYEATFTNRSLFHKKALATSIARLGDCELVARFKEYYSDWFDTVLTQRGTTGA